MRGAAALGPTMPTRTDESVDTNDGSEQALTGIARQLLGAVLMAIVLSLVAGCGGGGGGDEAAEPINAIGVGRLESTDARLGDGTLGDFITFTATRDGWVTVAMICTESSDSVDDPYVQVREGTTETWNSSTMVAYNDDSSSDTTWARASFRATSGRTYTALFSTVSYETGSYGYGIRENVEASAAETAEPEVDSAASQAERLKRNVR